MRLGSHKVRSAFTYPSRLLYNRSREHIQPLQIGIDLEEDVRFLASVPDLPGVIAYGDIQESATRMAKSIALQMLADLVESQEPVWA